MKKTFTLWLVILCCASACHKKDPEAPTMYVKFTKADLTISNYKGETDSFTVESNTSWQLSITGDAKDAVQLSSVSGTGNATVKITLNQELTQSATVNLVLAAAQGNVTAANLTVNIHKYNFITQWTKLIGGTKYEEVNNICLISQDQFLMSGFSSSPDIDFSQNFGTDDAMALTMDATGTLKGLKTAGGSKGDQFLSVAPTSDGGFIAVGYTFSSDHQVVGSHGFGDAWIVKFNSNGDTVWTRTWGGNGADYGTAIAAAPGGNFLVAGFTDSNNGDFPGSKGSSDGWVMKIDGNGNKLWQQFARIGGSDFEDLRAIVATDDEGCVVGGYSASTDITGTTQAGSGDAFVVKLSSGGQVEWQKLIGGTHIDFISAMARFPGDGSIVFVGRTRSPEGHNFQGIYDGWIVKLTSAGSVVWDKTFGSPSYDFLNTVTITADGGCIAAGTSIIDGQDVSGSKGAGDGWLLKVNKSGTKVWQKVLGGSNVEEIKAIAQTSDGDLFLAGSTSSADGDIVGPLKGGTDIWVTRLKVQ